MRINKMNKKAQTAGAGGGFEITTKAWYFTIGSFILVTMVFVLFVTASKFQTYKLNINQDFYITAYAERITNNCLAYVDPATGRVYPGIIDWNKITNGHMQDCFIKEKDDPNFAFNVTGTIDNEKKGAVTKNWVKNPWKVFTKNVLFWKDKKLVRGVLEIEVDL